MQKNRQKFGYPCELPENVQFQNAIATPLVKDPSMSCIRCRSRPEMSPASLTALIFGFCLGLTSPANATALKPRVISSQVAREIEKNYFDVNKGEHIAGVLRGRIDRGDFDRYRDPRDLAEALSQALRPMDTHFVVSFSPAETQQAGSGSLQDINDSARVEARQARSNFGFQAVTMLPGGLGYIDLRGFADFDGQAHPDARARRVADAALTLVSSCRALIIDLRENGGGSPAMVGYLIADFVPERANVFNVFKSRGPDQSERPVIEPSTDIRLPTVPLYTLVSGRTISAAESFAYTLQAAGRATIVGEATAGGANPGDTFPVDDGFSVFVSVASPINPITHTNWERTGVKPNVLTSAGQALTEASRIALGRLAASDLDPAARTRERWALEALSTGDHSRGRRPLKEFTGRYSGRTVALSAAELVYQYGREPRRTLIQLGPNLFYVRGLPMQRVKFERGPHGDVKAMEILTPDGVSNHLLKT